MNRRRRIRYKDAYNAASKFKEAEFGEGSLRRITTPLPHAYERSLKNVGP